MDYEKMSMQILASVGGKENVVNLTHCLTRLRFTLSDECLVNVKKIESIEGVFGTSNKGGQFQIVIGNDVEKLYKIIQTYLDVEKKEVKEKKSYLNSFLETVSAIFAPILIPLVAAGMLRVVLSLLKIFSIVSTTSSTYQVINFIADTIFYFLPIFLANSTAKRFGCNPYLAMMLGAVLIHPTFNSLVSGAKETGEALSIFGLPIYLAQYSSSVIPIILSVYFMSKVEKLADKIIPKVIELIVKPLFVLLVSSVAALVVLGPIGFIVADYITVFFNWLNQTAGWIVPTLIGGTLPFLVITGTQHTIIALNMNSYMTIGKSPFSAGALPANIAIGAASLALSLKQKDRSAKQIALSSGLTAIFGISEPALFGVLIKNKFALMVSSLSGAVAGFYLGINHVFQYSPGAPNLLLLPAYISAEAPNNIIHATIGTIIAFVVAFLAVFFFYKDKNASENEFKEELKMPIEGEVIPLEKVKDETFSKQFLGKGCAIIPTSNLVIAPANGIIKTVFHTKHAITMVTDLGVNLIIHVGIDTVKLNGEAFEVLVKKNEVVNVGDPLIKVDFNLIKSKGYDPTTVFVIANSEQYKQIEFNNKHIEVRGEEA